MKKCVTEEECYDTLEDGSYFTFNQTCISKCPHEYERVSRAEGNCKFCGNECVVTCPGMIVNSISSAQKMSGCTHVKGSLEIRVDRELIVPELQHLSSIRFIQGDLKIARSSVISSLEFLNSLRVINGTNLERTHALFVYENQNLKRLWDFRNFTLKINNGSVAFHNNPQLCVSEIDAFISVVGLKDLTDIDVWKYSNGNEALCNSTELVTHVKLNVTNVTVTWEPPKLVDDETLVGYAVFYTEYKEDSFDKMESKTVCSSNSWESIFVNDNIYLIKNLEPYTKYAYYIKTYTTTKATQSQIGYFRTLSDDPTEVTEFKGNATSYDTIKLTWQPPEKTNGKLAYYTISVNLVKDDQTYLSERNYCTHPHVLVNQETETPYSNYTSDNRCCTRNEKAKVGIFSHDMIAFCILRHNKMYTWDDRSCYRNLYYTETKGQPTEFQIENSVAPFNLTYREIFIPDPNATSYEAIGLKHFSMYAFWISACNVNETQKQQCSAVSVAYVRTLRLEQKDDISNLTVVKVEGSSVYITWNEPESPNGLINAYNIEYKKVDIEHPQNIVDCITRNDFISNNSIFVIPKMLPGEYKIHIQTVSLAGKGSFSPHIVFQIPDDSANYQWLPLLLSILIILCFASGIMYYFWYRRRVQHRDIYLITSVNPDYSGQPYVEDEWEINQDDLSIIDYEIGRGTFGKVVQGIIKSRNMPCAIKTVNETASEGMRFEFLNEASFMKTFSDAYHVVKLLGVVSKGPSPLVVMELMERGDLKSFLRTTRNSSFNLSSNETYRMAIEIADGMAYLSAKKFVHRDLAARNCMVAHDYTVKVGDFGMARDVYETDYYRKESRGLLPIRWMAPESLGDGVFTSDSDVWSYGVVLWEIATLAEQPYQGLSNEQVLRFVTRGGKLDRPQECSDRLYDMMAACWNWRPTNRPQFMDIVSALEDRVSETFKLLSFCHSQAGTHHRLHAGQRPHNRPALGNEPTYSRYNAYDDNVDLYLGQDDPRGLLGYSNQRRRRSSIVPSASSSRMDSPPSYDY